MRPSCHRSPLRLDLLRLHLDFFLLHLDLFPLHLPILNDRGDILLIKGKRLSHSSELRRRATSPLFRSLRIDVADEAISRRPKSEETLFPEPEEAIRSNLICPTTVMHGRRLVREGHRPETR